MATGVEGQDSSAPFRNWRLDPANPHFPDEEKLPIRAEVVRLMDASTFRFWTKCFVPGEPRRAVRLTGAWIAERCDIREFNRFGKRFALPRRLLWEDFRAWMVEREAPNREEQLTFYAALARLGHPTRKSNTTVVDGLEPKELSKAERVLRRLAETEVVDEQDWRMEVMDPLNTNLSLESRVTALALQVARAVEAMQTVQQRLDVVQQRLDVVQQRLDGVLQTNAWLVGQVSQIKSMGERA